MNGVTDGNVARGPATAVCKVVHHCDRYVRFAGAECKDHE
jgi:hypothetical protein